MSEHVIRSHNKNLLLYHLVCPAKYRKKIFSPEVEETVKQVCVDISERYEIHFVEIGTDENHVHFLIQSVPMLMPTQIVKTVKSITARETLARHPEIKKKLWGGKFWTHGYYINTVGRYGNETMIGKYVRDQGQTYKQIHRTQLSMFEGVGGE